MNIADAIAINDQRLAAVDHIGICLNRAPKPGASSFTPWSREK
jgi:hypothetical protein